MVRKLSQVSAASFPLAGGDRLLGVSLANADLLYPHVFTDVVSVVSYGADPTGVADSTSAIQTAFDYAWGPSSSPRGTAGPLAAVYFPNGTYKITSPLRITEAKGGYIFSSLNATLSWAGSFSGNTLTGGADTTITPILATDGFNEVVVENITFSMGTNLTNAPNNCCGIYGYGNFSSSASKFENCVFQGATVGAYLGVGSPNNVSEWKFYNCGFFHNGTAGVYISGNNSLNFQFVGCGAFDCGNAPLASLGSDNIGALVVTTGGINWVASMDFSLNSRDIQLGSGRTFITGVRTESPCFLSVESAAYAHVSSSLTTANQGTYTGSTGGAGGTTLTVSAVLGAINTGLVKGVQISGTQGGNSLSTTFPHTTIVSQTSGTPGGVGDYLISAAATPSNMSSTTITATSVFLRINGQGIAMLDNAGGTNASPVGGGSFMSNANGFLYVRGNPYLAAGGASSTLSYAELLRGFAGKILSWDSFGNGLQTVATLPTTNLSSFKGVRLVVTDATVAGSTSTNFGTIVAGGGANTVPVYCDGTNWRIG